MHQGITFCFNIVAYLMNNKVFFSDTFSIYIQTKEESDYSTPSLPHKINFLESSFVVHENYFKSLPKHSIVILDDFSFSNSATNLKQSKIDFLHVINYYLRHNQITLVLVVHNLYSNGLLNEILLAPHIFLAYSNLGYYIIKKLQQRLGGTQVLDFWQEPAKFSYHFCYINCNKNYLINCVDKLFLGLETTMFANHQKFVIHSQHKACSSNTTTVTSNIQQDLDDYAKNTYPKNKTLHLVFKPMLEHDLINTNLFFKQFPTIHVADFCSFINNRFYKNETGNAQMIKLCKYMQKKKIRFPKIAIRNPVAIKLFTM